MKGTQEQIIPQEIVKVIQSVGNVVLFTHTHPDGDALGSLFGFAEILDSLGKNVFCFLEEPVSHLYDFLPQSDRVSIVFDEYLAFVGAAGEDIVAVALDCGDSDRLGKFKDEFLKVTPFVVVDHHQSHRDFGTMRWVAADRSSTGEMVYELGLALKGNITYNCAYNLYVAICTDTGSFRYECTRPRTMQVAAELLERGVQAQEVGGHLYDNYSPERLKLLEMILSTMTLSFSDTIAFIHVSQQMLTESGATLQDVEGFVDFPRSIRTVKVAAFVKESKPGTVAVSLRAKGDCDVAVIAKEFNGGGHRSAAGFRCLDKTIAEVRREVEEKIRMALK